MRFHGTTLWTDLVCIPANLTMIRCSSMANTKLDLEEQELLAASKTSLLTSQGTLYKVIQQP